MHALPQAMWLAAMALLAVPFNAMAGQVDPLPTYTIVSRNGVLTPGRIDVPAGKRLRLNLQNEGPGPMEFENLDLRVEKVLGAGARSFVITPPLKPGITVFVDEFHPDTGRVEFMAR